MADPKRKDLPLPGIHRDAGVVRFWANRIVRDVSDAARDGKRLDLNDIVGRFHNGNYSAAEVEQFWALLGYSISGYGSLSFISERTTKIVDKLAEEFS